MSDQDTDTGRKDGRKSTESRESGTENDGSDARPKSEKSNELDAIEQLQDYSTSPLRASPLHVLDGDGEALCGSLGDDQQRFIERHGVEGQPTLSEKINEKDCSKPIMIVLGNLCGNCRQSLLSEEGTEALQQIEGRRKELVLP